jgi:hypothetical protein
MSKLSITIRPFLFFIFLVTFSASAQAPLDIRVALVIGNSSYKEVPGLVNPQNDAKAMSLMLKKLGFQVTSVLDGTKKDIDAAIDNMKASLQGRQAVAMIYYAGHGLQHNWDNYIIPIDFKNNSNIDLTRDAVNLKNILDMFSQLKTRMNIIVLDACRDNPFGSKLGSNKGLAQVDAPINTYIAFATAPGNVAQDGDDRSGYGLFTGYLIKELQQPATIEDVFKRVRLQVRKSSGGMQIPWDSSSLENDFSFNDGKKYTVQPSDFIKALSDEKNKEEKTKLLADRKKNEESLRLVAENNKKQISSVENLSSPIQLASVDRVFRPIEANQNSDLASEKFEWEKIADSKNPNDFYAFLYKYPNGLLSANANFRLEELDKRKIAAQTDKNGLTESLGLFKVKPGDLFTYSVVDKRAIFGTKERFNNFRVDKIQDGLIYLLRNAYRVEIRTLSGGYVSGYSDGQPLSFNPPRQDLPGEPLFVGKKWASASFQKSGNFESARTDKFQVLAVEDITTPAGTFKTFKIEMNARNDNATINQIYWIDADSGVRVKTIRIVNNHRNSSFNVNEISTLITKKNIYE